MNDDFAPVSCPMPDCGSPLHLVWSLGYGLYLTEMEPGSPVPDATSHHTSTWRVECQEGHVLLLPQYTGCGCVDGCDHDEDDYDSSDDNRTFRSHDRDRLVLLLIQLARGGAR